MRISRLTLVLMGSALLAQEAIRIGSRRELLVDDYLIERFGGKAELRLHQPERRDIVLVTDKPWEGNACAYRTIFRDGAKVRMFYTGNHYDLSVKAMKAHPPVICYAESTDGIK